MKEEQHQTEETK